jgi:hypothetical protein
MAACGLSLGQQSLFFGVRLNGGVGAVFGAVASLFRCQAEWRCEGWLRSSGLSLFRSRTKSRWAGWHWGSSTTFFGAGLNGSVGAVFVAAASHFFGAGLNGGMGAIFGAAASLNSANGQRARTARHCIRTCVRIVFAMAPRSRQHGVEDAAARPVGRL